MVVTRIEIRLEKVVLAHGSHKSRVGGGCEIQTARRVSGGDAMSSWEREHRTGGTHDDAMIVAEFVLGAATSARDFTGERFKLRFKLQLQTLSEAIAYAYMHMYISVHTHMYMYVYVCMYYVTVCYATQRAVNGGRMNRSRKFIERARIIRLTRVKEILLIF